MRKHWVWLAVGVITVFGQSGTVPVLGQVPALPYELRLSAEEIERLRLAWNDGLPYVPGEILVKFRDGSGNTDRLRAFEALGTATTVRPLAALPNVSRVMTLDNRDYDQTLSDLRAQADVEWAQPNYLRRLRFAPNDPGYLRQWNLDLIKMPRAWDINNGGSDTVVVAVIDSGVTTITETLRFKLWMGTGFETVGIPVGINPDLSRARLLEGQDFLFWNGPVVDMVGHGTHVAGTVLQETNNASGFAGIAFHAKLLPLKACVGYWEIQLALSQRGIPGFVRPDERGGCTDAAVASAIRYAADHGASVANLSLGGTDPSPILLDALRYAVSHGMFVAIAGGNGYPEGNLQTYPAKYAEAIDGVVAVGAVSRNAQRAFYSNTGSYIEIAAPGGDSRADGVAGLIVQASLLESDFDPLRSLRPRFDRYVASGQQGTSMATPHVAGIAALLISQGVTHPEAIERAIKRFARDLGRPGRDNEFGDGLLDAPATLVGNGIGVAR